MKPAPTCDNLHRMASRKQRVTVYAAPTSWDGGASGPANRERLRDEPATEFDPTTGRTTANPNGIRRFRRVSLILTYAAAQHLTREHVIAAERLVFAAFGQSERDPLAPIVDRQHGNCPIAASIDARREYAAMWRLIPPESRPVVERVALQDRPIRDGNSVFRARQMQLLRQGLDALT